MSLLALHLSVILWTLFGDFIAFPFASGIGLDVWLVVRSWLSGASSLTEHYGSVPMMFWLLGACVVVSLYLGATVALAMLEGIRRDYQLETPLGGFVDRGEAGPMMWLAFGLPWLLAAKRPGSAARGMLIFDPFIIHLTVAAAACVTFWALLRFGLPLPADVMERASAFGSIDLIRRMFVTWEPLFWAGGYGIEAALFWLAKKQAQAAQSMGAPYGAATYTSARALIDAPKVEPMPPTPDAPRRAQVPIIDPIEPPTTDPMPGPLSAPPSPEMPPAPGPAIITGPPLAPPSPKPWAMPAPPADEPSDPAPADDPSIQDPSIHDPADDPAPEMSDELRTVLNSALSALKGRWFDEAERRAKVALSMDPTCARAHVYELMAVLRVSSEDELLAHPSPIERHPLFQRALSFARGEDRQRLLAIAAIQRSGDPIV